MINASNEEICVELPASTKYRLRLTRLILFLTEFSCLYLPQGHTFISTVWL